MKRLLLLLITVPLFGQQIDHKQSWPKIELGYAVPDAFAKVSPGSSDEGGSIVLWTGGNCCREGGQGALMRVLLVTYGQPYESVQYPSLTPGNGEAAALTGDRAVFVEQRSATERYFEIGVRWRGLEPGKMYEWVYRVK
jgi:hypothetical protein